MFLCKLAASQPEARWLCFFRFLTDFTYLPYYSVWTVSGGDGGDEEEEEEDHS